MKNFKKLFLLLIELFLTFHTPLLRAANSIPARTKMPVILFKDEGNRYRELGIKSINIDIKVIGNIATTTTEITFYNDLNRVLEGQFYFPLSEGQTVSRFALDIRGKMREGVVVSKAKGRKVYEQTVRSMIDPGLLEWTKGNSFKSRIYPIPARGYKKLLIAYEQELKDNGRGFLYSLPLAFEQQIDKFSVKVEVYKQYVKPVLGRENEMINFNFRRWHESYIAKKTFKNYTPNKQLVFSLPKTGLYKKVVIEKDNLGENYFYIHLVPEKLFAAKKMPKKVCIIWDASDSAKNKDIDKELLVLQKYFKTVGNLSVSLVVFRNDVENKVESFIIKNGNSKSLISRIKKIKYDGATQMGSVDLRKYSCDEFILSTDGVSTFGKDRMLLAKKPVYVINSNLSSSHSYLKYIALKTGGIYINLTSLTTLQAEKLLSSIPFSFISATYNNANISQVYPSNPQAVTNDFSISGIMKNTNGVIKLNFGVGNKIKYTKTFKLSYLKQHIKTGLIKRIWAQKKISELDIFHKKNEKIIIETAKKHSVVTRYTSLIVLDRIEDYVKHRIVPPKELRNEYYALIQKEDEQKREKLDSNIDRVAELYNQLYKWWRKDFPLDTPDASSFTENTRTRRSVGGSSSIRDSRRLSRTEEARDMPSVAPAAARQSTSRAIKFKRPGSIQGSFITLKKSDPNAPYIKILKKVSDEQLYKTYLELKKKYKDSTAFFLDVADYFFNKNIKRLALRILSNIAEMELENHQLLRILGHRLSQLGYNKLSAFVFEEVLNIREEEPQSYRDLALVYAKLGKNQMAVDLLYEVIKKQWDRRFPEIEVIAAHEMNAIIANNRGLNISKIDSRLIRSMPVDIRVVLNWDMDNTDMDLWVFDPNKEKCYYRHRKTYVGGYMSRDFTRGYGPEIYMLRIAKQGKYLIKVNFYGHSQQLLAGATTVQLKLFLNYGKPNQIVKEITLRLKKKKQVIDVGSFTIVRKGGGEMTFK